MCVKESAICRNMWRVCVCVRACVRACVVFAHACVCERGFTALLTIFQTYRVRSRHFKDSKYTFTVWMRLEINLDCDISTRTREYDSRVEFIIIMPRLVVF